MRLRYGLVLSGLLIIGFALFGGFRLSGKDPSRIASRREPAEARCGFNRIMLSSSGNLALWRDESKGILNKTIYGVSEIAVSRIQDVKGAFETRSTLGRLIPIRWSSDGQRLTVRASGGDAVLVELGQPDRRRASEFAAFSNIDLIGVTDGDSPIAIAGGRDDARLREPVRLIGAVSTGVRLLGAVDDEIFSLVTSDADRLGLSGFEPLRLIPYARGDQPGFTYVGDDRTAARPYSQPIVDRATGEIIGRFSRTTVTLPANRRLQNDLLTNVKDRIILDVSASGRNVAALSTDLSGKLYVTSAGLFSHDVQVCQRRQPPPPAELAARVKVRNVNPTLAQGVYSEPDASRGPAAPFLVKYAASPNARTAIVYFHGGPGGTLFTQPVPRAVRELLTPGTDVIGVEYAGSLGTGSAQTRRLAIAGMPALESDARHVAQWLKRVGYRRIVILSESFGAVPAAHLSKLFPQDTRLVIYIAPFLRFRSPEEWVSKTPFGPTSYKGQVRFEKFFFGDAARRAKFGTELVKLFRDPAITAAAHFFFAERDLVSKTTDLDEKHQREAQITILPGGHAEISASSRMWDGIGAIVRDFSSHDEEGHL